MSKAEPIENICTRSSANALHFAFSANTVDKSLVPGRIAFAMGWCSSCKCFCFCASVADGMKQHEDGGYSQEYFWIHSCIS